MLDKNKKIWDAYLKYGLLAKKISTNIAIGSSPYQMVYGIDVIFPMNLTLPKIKLLQEEDPCMSLMHKSIYQMI